MIIIIIVIYMVYALRVILAADDDVVVVVLYAIRAHRASLRLPFPFQMLWAARSGVLESEILAILSIPQQASSSLYYGLQNFVTNRHGLLTFPNEQYRQACPKLVCPSPRHSTVLRFEASDQRLAVECADLSREVSVSAQCRHTRRRSCGSSTLLSGAATAGARSSHTGSPSRTTSSTHARRQRRHTRSCA